MLHSCIYTYNTILYTYNRYGQRFVDTHTHTETKTFFTGGVIIIFRGRTHRAHNINYTNRLHGRRSEGLIGKLVSVLIDTFINNIHVAVEYYTTLRTFSETVNQTSKHIEFRLITNMQILISYIISQSPVQRLRGRYHFYYYFGCF